MGPYCNYCDQRCFVLRRSPTTGEALLFATCAAGAAHDRAVTGHDFTTADPVGRPALDHDSAPQADEELRHA